MVGIRTTLPGPELAEQTGEFCRLRHAAGRLFGGGPVLTALEVPLQLDATQVEDVLESEGVFAQRVRQPRGSP